MSLTSFLYRLARFSADVRAGQRAAETGSVTPILRRIANKAIGRGFVSRLFFK